MISRVLRNLFTDYSHFPLLFLHSSIKKCALHMERREGEKVCVCVCVHFYTDCVSHIKKCTTYAFHRLLTFSTIIFTLFDKEMRTTHGKERGRESVCVCVCVHFYTDCVSYSLCDQKDG